MIKELVLLCFFVALTAAFPNPLGDDDSNQPGNIVVPAIAEDDDLNPAETFYRGGWGGGGYGHGWRGGYGGYRGHRGYGGYRGGYGRGYYW